MKRMTEEAVTTGLGPPIVAAVLAAALWAAPACGRKGPPRPPESALPKPVTALAARTLGGGALLAWEAPRENLDGSDLEDLKGFAVSRRRLPLAALDDLERARKLKGEERASALDSIIGEAEFDDIIEVPYPAGERGKGPRHVRAVDTDVPAGFLYEYDVRAVNEGGDESPPAPVPAGLPVPAFPVAPADLEATAGDGAVSLRWSPVPSFPEDALAGAEPPIVYRVYRRPIDGPDDESAYPDDSVNRVPVPEAFYEDVKIQNEQTYAYVVRAVRRWRGKVLVEGPSSIEATGRPTDRTAPPTPTGLMAIPAAAGVMLRWTESLVPDLLGYNVYRQTVDLPGTAAHERLTADPIREPAFTDVSAEPGRAYRYSVTAVDGSPARNESPPSTPVEARR